MTSLWHQTLNHLGLIRLSGEKTAEFLQGQLTCDVRELNKDKNNLLGAACDPKGRVLATFRLFQYENDFYLLLPNTMIEQTITHLAKYAVFSKVALTNDTKNWSVLGFGAETAEDIDSLQLPDELLFTISKHPYHALYLTKKDKKACVDITDLPQAPLTHWQYCNTAAGMVDITPETRGLFTPQMIDLGKLGGISFKKGCYVGQEIIARTEHLGKLKRHLHKVAINSATSPNPGDELISSENETLGIVVQSSQAKEPEGSYLCLAVIQNRALENNVNLFWKTHKANITD